MEKIYVSHEVVSAGAFGGPIIKVELSNQDEPVFLYRDLTRCRSLHPSETSDETVAWDFSQFGTTEEVLEAVVVHNQNLRFHNRCEHLRVAFDEYAVETLDPEDFRAQYDFCVAINSLFHPEIVDGKISLYKNLSDVHRGRKTTMKLGRALKFLMPKASDKFIESYVDRIREMFVKRGFKMHVGSDREAFRFAYMHDRARYLNPKTTSYRKSLASSCMHDVEVGGISPAEVYASGDFKVAYLTDVHGRLGGRVVYRVLDDGFISPGPLYGVCEHSLDLLQAHIDNHEVDCNDWDGAELLRIEKWGDLVGPYIDGHKKVSDWGDTVVIDSCGDLSCESTDGLFESAGCFCEYCEGRGDADDMTYVESHGMVCDSCIEVDFFQSESDYEWYHIDAGFQVVESLSSWGPRTLWVHRHDMDDYVFCERELNYDYWHIDLCTYVDALDLWVPNHKIDLADERYEDAIAELDKEKDAA
jgi:hypothetical protein